MNYHCMIKTTYQLFQIIMNKLFESTDADKNNHLMVSLSLLLIKKQSFFLNLCPGNYH